MALSREKVISFYNDYDEDARAATSRAQGLEFHYTKKFLSQYIHRESNVIEIGCATGYYGMFFSDTCAHYTGIDLVQRNIDIFNHKIVEAGKQNITALVGDATDLSIIPGDHFDVVLCLGPMYHLPQEDRLKVFDECRRIARKDAVLAFAYINRIGSYVGACMYDDWRDIFPNAEANRNVLQLSKGFFEPEAFWCTSPEEMEHDAKKKGLKIQRNCGLDFFFAQSAINRMSEEQFACYMEIADQMCGSPSCTGLADHALLICAK